MRNTGGSAEAKRGPRLGVTPRVKYLFLQIHPGKFLEIRNHQLEKICGRINNNRLLRNVVVLASGNSSQPLRSEFQVSLIGWIRSAEHGGQLFHAGNGRFFHGFTCRKQACNRLPTFGDQHFLVVVLKVVHYFQTFRLELRSRYSMESSYYMSITI